jgi:primosomal protein N' (replication factor Y)
VPSSGNCSSKSLVERCDLPPDQQWSTNPGLAANPEQQEAIKAIGQQLGRFGCHVLQGVTGSGKTEVYLQLIAETVRRGQQALVLLPEIALTPQMLERFRERFIAPVIELHSGLSDSARDRNWAAARKGEAAVVIGTRSAVFTPLAKPGLIIIDEEHEATFTQQRRAALFGARCRRETGSAQPMPGIARQRDPSLETLDNIERGRFSVTGSASAQAPQKCPSESARYSRVGPRSRLVGTAGERRAKRVCWPATKHCSF